MMHGTQNIKYMYSYLKFIVYDKLLKARQSFSINLYSSVYHRRHIV
jgi:hypothetical protein